MPSKVEIEGGSGEEDEHVISLRQQRRQRRRRRTTDKFCFWLRSAKKFLPQFSMPILRPFFATTKREC